MSDAATTVLFLCTGNSARSILAEAIARQRFGDRLDARSAGSRPKDAPHPLALETLRRHGLETAGLRSKRIDEIADGSFDLVITLCGSARDDGCPTLPGAPTHVHWPFPDPPAATDPAAAFEAVFTVLSECLAGLAAPDGEPIVARAERMASVVARRFAAPV